MNTPLTRIPITFPGPLVALLGDPKQLDPTVGLSFCGDDLYIRTRSGSRMAGHTGTIAWSRVLHSPSLTPWMAQFDLYPDESTGIAPDPVLFDVHEGAAFVGPRDQVERSLNGPVAQPVEPMELDDAALEEINQ